MMMDDVDVSGIPIFSGSVVTSIKGAAIHHDGGRCGCVRPPLQPLLKLLLKLLLLIVDWEVEVD